MWVLFWIAIAFLALGLIVMFANGKAAVGSWIVAGVFASAFLLTGVVQLFALVLV